MNQTCPLLDLHWVQLSSVHWAQWDPFSFPFTVSASRSCARHPHWLSQPLPRPASGLSPAPLRAGPGSGGPTLWTVPSRAWGLGTGTRHMLGALSDRPTHQESSLSSSFCPITGHSHGKERACVWASASLSLKWKPGLRVLSEASLGKEADLKKKKNFIFEI